MRRSRSSFRTTQRRCAALSGATAGAQRGARAPKCKYNERNGSRISNHQRLDGLSRRSRDAGWGAAQTPYPCSAQTTRCRRRRSKISSPPRVCRSTCSRPTRRCAKACGRPAASVMRSRSQTTGARCSPRSTLGAAISRSSKRRCSARAREVHHGPGHNGRQAVTLVAADRKEAQRLIGFLSERRIHRLLIKPPAAGITRLLIESAANRCLQLRSAAVASPPVVSAPKKAGARIPTWRIAAGVAVLCLAVALAVASYRVGSSRSAGAAADQATAGAAAPIDRFADWLRAPRLRSARAASPIRRGQRARLLPQCARGRAHAREGTRRPRFRGRRAVRAGRERAAHGLARRGSDLARCNPENGADERPLAFLDAALARSRADAAKPRPAATTSARRDRRNGDSAAQAESRRCSTPPAPACAAASCRPRATARCATSIGLRSSPATIRASSGSAVSSRPP